MRLPRLGASELSDIAAVHRPFATSTPAGTTSSLGLSTWPEGCTSGRSAPGSSPKTLVGLLREDPTSYLNAHPRFHPFLGADLKLGPMLNPNITGNRAYTRAHFLYYAGAVTPGTYR